MAEYCTLPAGGFLGGGGRIYLANLYSTIQINLPPVPAVRVSFSKLNFTKFVTRSTLNSIVKIQQINLIIGKAIMELV